MSNNPIYKTKIEVVVYSREPFPDELTEIDERYHKSWLHFVADEIYDGDKIGDYKIVDTNMIAHKDVRAELIAIGNDGDFFDDTE